MAESHSTENIFKMKTKLRSQLHFFVVAATALALFGCATSKIDWNSRIGSYTSDQAVLDFGPPERSATLTDGRTVSEWLLYRGDDGRPNYFFTPAYGSFWSYNRVEMPDRFLRLTFSPSGKLEKWKRVMK